MEGSGDHSSLRAGRFGNGHFVPEDLFIEVSLCSSPCTEGFYVRLTPSFIPLPCFLTIHALRHAVSNLWDCFPPRVKTFWPPGGEHPGLWKPHSAPRSPLDPSASALRRAFECKVGEGLWERSGLS